MWFPVVVHAWKYIGTTGNCRELHGTPPNMVPCSFQCFPMWSPVIPNVAPYSSLWFHMVPSSKFNQNPSKSTKISMHPQKIIATIPLTLFFCTLKPLFHETNEKQIRNISGCLLDLSKNYLNPSKSNFSGHPHSKPLQLQFNITFTHISPLISLKYSKIWDQPEILLSHNGCHCWMTKPRWKLFSHWLLNLTSSVIGLSPHSSQSQPSQLNFKQFAKSNFLSARYVLPHRWEKKQGEALSSASQMHLHRSTTRSLPIYRHFFWLQNTYGCNWKSSIFVKQDELVCKLGETGNKISSTWVPRALRSPVKMPCWKQKAVLWSSICYCAARWKMATHTKNTRVKTFVLRSGNPNPTVRVESWTSSVWFHPHSLPLRTSDNVVHAHTHRASPHGAHQMIKPNKFSSRGKYLSDCWFQNSGTK